MRPLGPGLLVAAAVAGRPQGAGASAVAAALDGAPGARATAVAPTGAAAVTQTIGSRPCGFRASPGLSRDGLWNVSPSMPGWVPTEVSSGSRRTATSVW